MKNDLFEKAKQVIASEHSMPWWSLIKHSTSDERDKIIQQVVELVANEAVKADREVIENHLEEVEIRDTRGEFLYTTCSMNLCLDILHLPFPQQPDGV